MQVISSLVGIIATTFRIVNYYSEMQFDGSRESTLVTVVAQKTVQ